MPTAKPIHEIRLGQLRAAVWLNGAEGRTWFNVTITRRFQERGGEWKESMGFGRDDLPVVAKLADMAYAWIWTRSSELQPNTTNNHRGPS